MAGNRDIQQQTHATNIEAITSSRMNAMRAPGNIVAMVAIAGIIHSTIALFSGSDAHLYWFLSLFVWRYLRFIVNMVAFWCYSPAPRPNCRPTYLPARDVTAVIPTVDPGTEAFREGLKACAENGPAKIVVVTAGDKLFAATRAAVNTVEQHFPSTQFVVLRTQVVSKRAQVAMAVPHIDTDITVLLDDHAFWGPRYLDAVLCAFEDPGVGLVGTSKRVRRREGLGLWGRIWNMLGATYLCRHNFEIRATNTVDGGVFVVSGRTCAIRTQILRDPEFLRGYTNEKFFFGLFGPLRADDDNYTTRFAVRRGWRIKIQDTEDATMETVLGVEPAQAPHTKFLGQCRRWARSTWRSNLCSLVTDRSVWARQPYCVYAVYLTSLTNFAAVIDPLLVYLFARSSACVSRTALAVLVCWILLTKTVKVFDYFRRHPYDIVLFPAYVAFAYFHSLIKLWTLLTFWDCTWCGRHLELIEVANKPNISAASPSSQAGDQDKRQHPHVPKLRALQGRIVALHMQHVAYIASYQLPLLKELQQLTDSLVSLRRDQRVMTNHHATIRGELRRVAEHADNAAAAQDDVLPGEAEVVSAVANVTDVVGGVEKRWRDYVRGPGAAGSGQVAVSA